MLEAEAWFRELIKDQITIQYQARGGYLDGTMSGGDLQAGTYKFPILGRLSAVQLTGAIQLVQAGNADMDTVSVSPTDYEASTWIRTQDIYKMGPNAQAALGQLLSMAIRRKADEIKRDALNAFTSDVGTQDIGGSATLIDPLLLEQGRAQIAATGADDMALGQVFCPVMEMWMSQMCQYREWNDADFAGPDNLPWSKAARTQAKTVNGVTYFTMPDETFLTDDGGTSYLTWMWGKSAIGAETPWNMQAPTFTQHTEYEGSPWLGKVGLGGCAVGIQRAGVKKLRFKAQTALERIPVLTQAA